MNLNIFKRIADLEAKLKKAEVEIDLLKTIVYKQSNWLKTLENAKQTESDKIAKRKAYARTYYLKKKAGRVAK